MAQSKVRVTIEDPVATITLARPEKLNAIDPDMLCGLEESVTLIEDRTTVRVAILTGRGNRAFSVGADIHAWSALQPLDMWRKWIREGQRVLDRIARLRVPLIAAVNGFAFGGGLELALAADIRLASTEASFAMPEVTIGTVPGWGGTVRLPALIGPARAKEMILGGGRVDATTAERWGLVNHVYPLTGLLAEAHSLANRIAENAPVAVQLAKELIAGGETSAEALAGALAATTRDAQHGAASFREKRPPAYKGQ